MKTKRIEISGRVFRLAPLSLGQVEQLVDAELPLAERVWLPIVESFVNSGQMYEIEELKEFLDFEDFTALHDAVLELNDLKREALDTSPQDPLDFSYLRARLSASCGWTLLEADRQPFVDILSIFQIWADEAPPLERSFAAFVGFKSKPRGAGHMGGTDSSRDELVNFTGQWGGEVHKSADNLPVWMQASLAQDGFLKFEGDQGVDAYRPPGLQ